LFVKNRFFRLFKNISSFFEKKENDSHFYHKPPFFFVSFSQLVSISIPALAAFLSTAAAGGFGRRAACSSANRIRADVL
jgi:hypothetical protein